MQNEESRPGGQSGAAQEIGGCGTSTKVEVTALGWIEQHVLRPPAYGSSEWEQLPDCDPRKQAALVLAAECWRILDSSPHLEPVLSEWRGWLARQQFRDDAAAISALRRFWVRLPTFAELERRRSTYTTEPLSPAQIRAKARASWAALDTNRRAA